MLSGENERYSLLENGIYMAGFKIVPRYRKSSKTAEYGDFSWKVGKCIDIGTNI